MITKFKSLPSWVNEDNGLVSVGSATYKGQSFIQQKNQAVAVASMNLGRKIKTKVDSLTRDFFQGTTNENSSIEEFTSQTTSQVSSEVIRGMYVKNIYVSDDGELFVQLSVNEDVLLGYYHNNKNLQKFLKIF